jgi:hypothetical protein
VLAADLDLDDIVRGKFDLDVSGHYARPDGDDMLCAIVSFQADNCAVFQLLAPGVVRNQG